MAGESSRSREVTARLPVDVFDRRYQDVGQWVATNPP
jgi:hypothetical protein